VAQVVRINRDQIQPPPLSVLSVSHQYVAGLARLEDRLVIVLDIERLFDERSAVLSSHWGAEKSGEAASPTISEA
jgi:chemotaxis signal transduction protein